MYLRRIVNRILALGLLGCAGAASGSCGVDNPNTDTPLWSDIDTKDFAPIPLLSDLDYDAFAIKPKVDYWEIRLIRFAAGEGGVVTAPTEVTASTKIIGSSGKKCANASDQTHCVEMFTALTAPTITHSLLGNMYIASTTGSNFQTWVSRKELLAFLGPIDTPEEAILMTKSIGAQWDPKNKERGGIRKINEGYELITVYKHCGGQLDRYLLLVTPAGEVNVLRMQVVIRSSTKC